MTAAQTGKAPTPNQDAMTEVLVIDSSSRLTGSASRMLTDRVIEMLEARHAALNIIRRDLAREAVPHLDEAMVTALRTPQAAHTEEHSANLQLSDKLIDEIIAADMLVIGVPMYNFGIPSVLKAYIDHIARAGRTFSYGADGRPQGLLGGKPALILIARGGIYGEGPMQQFEHQETYLRAIFGFLGIVTEFVRIEGTAFGPEALAGAFQKAEAALLETHPFKGAR